MPSVYDLKPKFQNLLRPLIKWLLKNKITPNMITLIALLGSVVIGSLVFSGFFRVQLLLIWPIWLFIRMALNALDGMMAREHNMSSYSGFILNELGDILSDFFLYFPLAFIMSGAFMPVLFFCIGAIFTEICGILPKAANLTRRYEGPMGKSDRAFFVGVVIFFSVFIERIGMYWNWLFLIASLLTLVTCVNRLKKSLIENKGA